LAELPESDTDICHDSMACERCLSICSISSKDGNSKASFTFTTRKHKKRAIPKGARQIILDMEY
jgi:hypothetical protein